MYSTISWLVNECNFSLMIVLFAEETTEASRSDNSDSGGTDGGDNGSNQQEAGKDPSGPSGFDENAKNGAGSTCTARFLSCFLVSSFGRKITNEQSRDWRCF